MLSVFKKYLFQLLFQKYPVFENSITIYLFSFLLFAGSSGRRSSGSRHVSSTTVTSSEAQQQQQQQQQNAQGSLPGVPIPVSNASNLSVNAPPPAEGLVPSTGEP